jgi:hypothetical protein
VDIPAPAPSLLQPPVASNSRVLRSRSSDGRLRRGLRDLVPGPSLQRSVGQHDHDDTYQCEGDYCLMGLSGGRRSITPPSRRPSPT